MSIFTITLFGLFEYLFMPFGLRNTAQTFQRFMDSLFKHLPFVFCYLDDIIMASHTLEEHHEHLRQIFTVLQENGAPSSERHALSLSQETPLKHTSAACFNS